MEPRLGGAPLDSRSGSNLGSNRRNGYPAIQGKNGMGLEDGLDALRTGVEPVAKASLLLAAGELAGLRTGIWMGGAHSRHGEPLLPANLESAVVVDAAGDMPPEWRASARAWVPCVFGDIDSVPVMLDRIHGTVRSVAEMLRAPDAPAAVYSMCQHGMNRSGLIAGLLLRELGLSGPEALELIRERRRGALSNWSFVRLIESYEPG
jgi:hypothetical protein